MLGKIKTFRKKMEKQKQNHIVESLKMASKSFLKFKEKANKTIF